MYFSNAVKTITEIGWHGDNELPPFEDKFNRDDRRKRIDIAASSLCDFVYEYIISNHGDGNGKPLGIFTQEHLPIIAKMIANGMMAQWEFDESMAMVAQDFERL